MKWAQLPSPVQKRFAPGWTCVCVSDSRGYCCDGNLPRCEYCQYSSAAPAAMSKTRATPTTRSRENNHACRRSMGGAGCVGMEAGQ
mmetsp:Transcript_107574/g.304229  ORF Transcript_107574/g.304229 Transcript_107574/m.304229 type:complete len:86 (+) Transcript_107574:43-300(+)